MAMHLLRITLLFLLIISTKLGSAQISNVNPAINIINGKAFYVHKVLDGQEIEEIAAAYFSDIPPIIEANPSIRAGLRVGMKLKIPFSDASLEPLSKIQVPDEEDEVVEEPKRMESQPIEPVRSVSPTAPKPEKKNQSPMQEAIALLNEVEQNEPEPVLEKPILTEQKEAIAEVAEPAEPNFTEPTKFEEEELIQEVVPEMKTAVVDSDQETEEPEEINSLAQSIRESLNTLQKMKEVLSGESVDQALNVDVQMNQDGSPKTVIQFVEEDLAQFIANDSVGGEYILKEYFRVRFFPSGVIAGLKDERTETNENTHHFEMNDLIGLTSPKFPNLEDKSAETAYGIIADVQLFRYKVKVKKNKIKLYSDDFYVEHLKKDHRHYQLIMDHITASGEYGKYVILIVDGEMATARFEQKEYNPFALLKDTIEKENIMRIESIEQF